MVASSKAARVAISPSYKGMRTATYPKPLQKDVNTFQLSLKRSCDGVAAFSFYLKGTVDPTPLSEMAVLT